MTETKGCEGGEMDESLAARYWCHVCSQMVNPVMEVEIKCPSCQSGFIEEMGSSSTRDSQDSDTDLGSDRALSLWAPILLGMMSNPRSRRRRVRRREFDEDNDNDDIEARHGGETELDWELESIIRRRRRNSVNILQMLQGMQTGLASESENSEGNRDRDRERVILINPLNQTIIVQGLYDSSQGQNQNHTPIGSLGDYFIGPGLDLLLQHLAENDPNRYGTPPAKKEAVEAMPTVKIDETVQCSVCLDDFEVGAEAKEMPCKHKFHSGCIMPWLELHSSCPVCRFQLPADESKLDADGSGSDGNRRASNNGNGDDEDGDSRNGSGRRFSFPWPFNGLFSSSGSQTGNGNSSSSPTNSSANAHGSASHTDEN